MLQQRMSREHTVVGLYNRSRHLGRRVNGETKLGLFPVVYRETLEEQTAETRSSTTSNSIEYEETLQAGAVVCKLPDTV